MCATYLCFSQFFNFFYLVSVLLWSLSLIIGRHTEKLQPKPKLQNQEETHCSTVHNPDNVPPVPSQTDNFDEGSIPAVPLDDMIDFSSMEFDDSVPIDPAPEISGFVVTSFIEEQNIVPDPSDVGVQHCKFHAFLGYFVYSFVLNLHLLFSEGKRKNRHGVGTFGGAPNTLHIWSRRETW